jgi:hypothetical protein
MYITIDTTNKTLETIKIITNLVVQNIIRSMGFEVSD